MEEEAKGVEEEDTGKFKQVLNHTFSAEVIISVLCFRHQEAIRITLLLRWLH